MVVGASGAGKTTVLNILGGMDTATSGKVLVDGETIDYLIKNHYASQRPNKSLWIAFENKYHPEKTISNLVRAIELAEEKKKEEEMKQK